ncbi:MAG: hypothetical protein RR900_08940, partial [Ruthenibacterium sp.]
EYEKDLCHPALPTEIYAVDSFGREIPTHLLSAQKDYYTHLQDYTSPEIYKVNRCKIALNLPSFPYGLSAITLRTKAAEPSVPSSTGLRIENEFYVVSPDATGSFSVTCKATGTTFTGVGRLVDKGDAGDEYTYSWPLHDTVYTLESTAMKMCKTSVEGFSQSLSLEGIFKLPAALLPNRTARESVLVDNPVRITAALHQNCDYVDFSVEFDNHAKDHILQMEIPTGVKAAYSAAS